MTDTVFRRAYKRTEKDCQIAINLAKQKARDTAKIERAAIRQRSARGTKGCKYCDR